MPQNVVAFAYLVLRGGVATQMLPVYVRHSSRRPENWKNCRYSVLVKLRESWCVLIYMIPVANGKPTVVDTNIRGDG